jgi:polar amino acid transport system substrate-binding protein
MFLGIRHWLPIACAAFIAVQAAPASAQSIPKKLTIGSSLSQTPWGFYDDKQNPTGIDVALCGALAKELGSSAEFVNLDFKGLIPALQADRFEMICAAVYITPEREKIVTMIPYITTSQAILAKAGTTIKGLADLCGRTVSVLQGSAQLKVVEAQSEACTKAGKPAVTIQSFDTQPIAVRALENGNVEAFVASDQLVSFYQLKNTALVKAATGINPVTLGIVVKQDNPTLAETIRAGLTRMKEKGSYAAILKEWGIEGAGLTSFAR